MKIYHANKWWSILRYWRCAFYLFSCLTLLHLIVQGIFFSWNRDLFTWDSIKKDLPDLIGFALQIDAASIVLINFPIIILLLLGSYSSKENLIIKISSYLAMVINVAALLLNILDVGYFRYSKERGTVALATVVEDSLTSVPAILKDFFPLIVCAVLIAWLTISLIRHFFLKLSSVNHGRRLYLVPLHLGILLFLFLIARGIRELPLIPSTPLLSVNPLNLPLSQNSAHTFLYSIVRRQNQLARKNYFSNEECGKILSLNKSNLGIGNIGRKKNIVVFILESFSAEYFENGNKYRASTPFFDSLISKSLYFPNAHANAFTSNHGIVAILGGLPNFLDEPFYYSTYANAKMLTVGSIFKKSGYTTNFFMGAGEDHFGFGKFCKMIEIDNYYGRRDFNDDSQYDGNWGIFDEPFLQYGLKKLNQESSPFFSVFFTISSHPPFTVPAGLNFQGESPSMKSIAYVDYAFKAFFDSAKHASWFDNTLFVFSADHWLAQDDESWSFTKSSAIPVFIYDPCRQIGRVDNSVAGQVDLMPTVLDMLNYNGAFMGSGKSLLDSTSDNRYVVNKFNGVFQVITDEWVLGYDERTEQTKYLYHHKNDGEMKQNLLNDQSVIESKNALERIIKASIQQYNNSLLDRNLGN